MTTRALYRAIAIPGAAAPYDRATLKIYYPAQRSDSEEERNSGVVNADPAVLPCPVVILLPGINVGPESYGWLARLLAEQGVISVTFTHVAQEMPGYVSLTPGLSLERLARDKIGQSPSATVIEPILEDLGRINNSGVLAGCMDLDRIALGGHSAGGSVALLNARADWFAGLRAVFSYGAHTGAATALGYPQDSFFPTPSELPLLIMGGNRDGCIAHSAARYGNADKSSTERVERTFDEALNCSRGDCYLAIIDGANHFSMAHPADDTTGRPFIDLPTTQPDDSIRALLGDLVTTFIDAHLRDDQEARLHLATLLEPTNPLLARGDRR